MSKPIFIGVREQKKSQKMRIYRHPIKKDANRPGLSICAIPDLDTFVKYDPSYILDKLEWFRISKFKDNAKKNGINLCLLEPSRYSSMNTLILPANELAANELANIAFFAEHHSSEERLYIQKITETEKAKQEKDIFLISQGAIKFVKTRVIQTEKLPDAVYDYGKDTLYFRNILLLKDILPGIENLDQEASNDRIIKALDMPFIVWNKNLKLDQVGAHAKKRIWRSSETIKKIKNGSISKKTVIAAAKEHQLSSVLVKKDNNIHIETIANLDIFSKFLNEQLFNASISKEPMYTNSKHKINP